jgi:hypothetical protein
MAGHYIAPDEPGHTTGTRKGEEITADDGREEGRVDKETSHAGRPSGGRTARDSTGVNPEGVESTTDGPKMPPA